MNRRDFLKSSTLLGLWLGGGHALASPLQQAATVEYWHNFIAEFVFAGFEKVHASFEEANPDITISPLTVPNADFMTKFTTSVVGGAAPDTTMAQVQRIPDMVAIGGLQDITDRVEGWALRDDFSEDLWANATIDGRIYALPTFMFVDWMYYRADWFDEAGIDPPTTYEEFTEAAIAMTDPSQGRYGFGMRGGAGGQSMVLSVLEGFGVEFLDDEGQPAMDFDKTVEALSWYTGLHTEHGAVPPSVVEDSFRQIMEGFQTGQTAMLWHHTGSLAEMFTVLGREGAFMTHQRPDGPVARIANASANYNGIGNDPQDADAAWEWVSYWGEVDTQVMFLEETGYFPASTAAAQDERVTGNPIYAPAVDTVNLVGPPASFAGVSGWAQTIVLPAFQRILLGELTPEQAAEQMITGLEETVSM